ncbi:MAG: peptide deformylase [Planctomycetes bacterium]|nr:peptide deformylase [Planctomycetota bacterium]
MNELETIDIATLGLIHYPDPRLREVCLPVRVFDDRLKALVARMFAVMYSHNGVGLAAAQLGIALRLFVANATHQSADERVYINPELIDNRGAQEGDEGCLSFPGITSKIKRYAVTTIHAQDLAGGVFEQTAEGLLASIFQHENDHLSGQLLVDRMSVVAKIANRRSLRQMEATYNR